MKDYRIVAWITALLMCPVVVGAAATDDLYTLGPDSEPHPDVPQGKIIGPLALTMPATEP